MWFLASVKCADIRFSLQPGKDLVVGRKDCDILIQSDQSISRKHAIIQVEKRDKLGTVVVTDCKSKFGTQINGKKISANSPVQLHHNDVIRFGQGPKDSASVFRLVHEPLVLCCSGMSGPEKARVKQLARELGASLVSNWSTDCSHLVMSSITVTVKVVSALASCRPIVTPAWLEEAAKCLKSNTVLPACSGYLPEIVDPNIGSSEAVNFAPDFRRRSLFQDRVFYFFVEKQFSRLAPCVRCAGAQCKLATSRDSVPSLDALAVKESIVLGVGEDLIHDLTDEQSQWIGQVNTFLSSRGLRPIMDSEIGFALLHISADRFCNPRNPTGAPQVNPHLPPPSLSQQAFYSFHSTSLPFTQDQNSHTVNVTVLAPDSEAATHTQPHSLGVKHEQGTEDSTTQVRSVVDETVLRSTKRKPPAAKSKPTTSSTNLTIDSLFDSNLGRMSFPPAEVKSKKPLASSTQTEMDVKEGGGLKGKGSQFKASDKSESSLVEDSQPGSELPGHTVLPGLRTLTQEVSPSNRNETRASRAADLRPSQEDTSVLVPSSLTPRSQQEGALPDNSLISALFKGRRKKRGMEGEGGSEASQKKRHRLDEGGKEDVSGTRAGADVFSGLRSTRTKRTTTDVDLTEPASTPPTQLTFNTNSTHSAVSNPNGKSLHISSEKRPTADKLPSELKATTWNTSEQAREETETETSQSLPRLGGSTGTGSVGPEHSTSQGFKTPKRRNSSTVGETTSFLSARKRKKSSGGDFTSDTTVVPPRGTQPSTDTQATRTQTQTTVRTKMTSPFTSLVMPLGISGGRRTKTQSGDGGGEEASRVEDLWDNDEAHEGENPLGGTGSQWGTTSNGHSMYQPVCTEGGFILPRKKPKVKASRMGRLGLLGNGSDPSSVGESNIEAAPPVEVAVVSLVVDRERRRREGEEDRRSLTEERWGRMRNFKKFKKVQNIGAGIPRIVRLIEYVPESTGSRWLEEDMEDGLGRERGEEEEEAESRMDTEDSSQSLFKFTVPSRKPRLTS